MYSIYSGDHQWPSIDRCCPVLIAGDGLGLEGRGKGVMVGVVAIVVGGVRMVVVEVVKGKVMLEAAVAVAAEVSQYA